MDAKQIKSALKEARDSIKKKDFNNALELCKAVLKADRNNYVCLVLFGVSLQETERKDQAPNAFRKAIDVSPNQSLAWQGLASYYEKEESKEHKKALLPVYEQLLKFESDLNKFGDICNKMAAVTQSVGEEEMCVKILEKQEQVSSVEQQRIIWTTMVSAVSLKNITPKLAAPVESALAKIIEDGTFEGTEEYFKTYLKLLYKNKKIMKLLDKARKMHLLYPKMDYPLEWICKVYSEQVTVDIESMNVLDNIIQDDCNKLTELNPNSSTALMAKGADLYRNGSYVEAIEIFKQVVSVMPDSQYVWTLLCQCYISTHCFMDAEYCAEEALKRVEKQSPNDTFLKTLLSVALVKSLCYQNQEEKLMLSIEKGKKILEIDHGNLDVIAFLARAYISLDREEETEKCIAVLEDNESYESIAMLLTAIKLKKEGFPEEAKEQLTCAASKDPLISEIWLELGKLLWEEGRYDKSLKAFLRATKLDPNCSTCFVYLGHHYKLDNRDFDKARRCYQKAFQLNIRSEEAGASLSDIYRLQKYTDLNEQLLKYVTQEAGVGGAKWAWLRLGLHHQEQGNLQEAVGSLQSAVRGDHTDSHCWESLADAYFARGSYTSALQSYQRVVELNPESLYSAIQVASIKQMLGEYEEAVAEFKAVVGRNPRYVPALKGLGEARLFLAKTCLAEQLLGRCRDLCQEALDVLTNAVLDHRSLSCLWKLIGDACSMMVNLPDNVAKLNVQRWLIHSSPKVETDEDTTTEFLNKEQAVQLGARCYCRALSVAPNSSLLWHDLAVNYHYQANIAATVHLKKQLREWAFKAAKNSVTLNPKIWNHWNILGIVAVSNEIKNLKLAQHAFIKAIELENNNAVAWTNLGTIYLNLNDIELANKAFRAAQRTEPTYMECWIGQALLAESLNHGDTMDLFRHTTSLGVHRESCMGYSQWVCSTLRDSTNKNDPHYVYSIEKMHAVTVAGDAITWYTTSLPNNPCALNMLGLLTERQKLYTTAADAFARALKLLEGEKDSELQDKVRCNYARMLVQLQKYDDAIHYYLEVKQATFVSQCGLAVAYFKAEKYQDSYDAYENVLHWLASDDGLKSHVLVAMAAMAYKFKNIDSSKTLLFQCVQLKPPSVHGLFASCSLGILHGDLNLSEIVLKELVPYKDDPEYVTHIAVFKAYAHFLQKRSKEASRSLCSTVHRHPGQASLWLALGLLVLNLHPNSDPSGATQCAQRAMALGKGIMDVSKIMSLVSLSHLLSGDATLSLRSSQKAVHMFPDIPENWVVLIASFLPWCIAKHSPSDISHLKNLIGHVRRKMDATRIPRPMAKWLSNHERKVALLAEEF